MPAGPTDEEAHDVLAAEEFPMPSPDPSIQHGPVALPEDPTGIAEPHDVLAAEEFAMPAPPFRVGATALAGREDRTGLRLAFGAALAALALWLAVRLIRRR